MQDMGTRWDVADGPSTVGGALMGAFRSWRGGSGAVPTTLAGAEIAVMVTVVGWRIGTLVQILPAIGDGVTSSPRPWLYAAVLAVILLESVALCWYALSTRGFLDPVRATVDVAVAAAALVAQPLYVAGDQFIGTWAAWAPGFAINAVVVAALGFRGRLHVFVAAAVLGACYVVISWPHAESATQMATVRSNGLSYLVFAAMSRTMVGFVRRFGRDADDARTAAIEAARVAELERHRRLLHDQASLLRLLADPSIDPALAEPLRRQARAESNRLRRFLEVDAGQPRADGPSDTCLVDLVVDVTDGFRDLPLSLMLDLGREVQLPPSVVEPVRSAVATALHNVRLHAPGASSVVLHTDVLAASREWELTIRDDGPGFDPSRTRAGFGLSRVLGSGLREVGVEGVVHSSPGDGTAVVLRGAL